MNNPFDPGLRDRIREAFERPVSAWVRVTPKGFLLEGESSPREDLEGRVLQVRLVRKLFRNGAIACQSPDGIRARDGTLCSQCLHPMCRPQLRIRLAARTVSSILDLSGRSAENLLALQDMAEAEGLDLVDLVLRLKVTDQGSWGEVRFERLPPQGDRP